MSLLSSIGGLGGAAALIGTGTQILGAAFGGDGDRARRETSFEYPDEYRGLAGALGAAGVGLLNQNAPQWGGRYTAPFSNATTRYFDMARNYANSGTNPYLKDAMRGTSGLTNYNVPSWLGSPNNVTRGALSGLGGFQNYSTQNLGYLARPNAATTGAMQGLAGYGNWANNSLSSLDDLSRYSTTAGKQFGNINNWSQAKLTGLDDPTWHTRDAARGYRDVIDYGGSGVDPINAGRFGDAAAQRYMDPYLKNVLDQQREIANRRFQEQQLERDAAAVKRGTFGGSRGAVADSLAQRDMNEQLALMEAEGYQDSYKQARDQFNIDRDARFRARELEETFNQGRMGIGLQGLAGLTGIGKQLMDARFGREAALATRRGLGLQAAQGTAGIGELQSDLRLKREDALQGRRDIGLEALQSRLQGGLDISDMGFRAEDAMAQRRSLGLQALAERLGAGFNIADDQMDAEGLRQAANQMNLGANAQLADLAALSDEARMARMGLMQEIGETKDARRQGTLDARIADFYRRQYYPLETYLSIAGTLPGTGGSTTVSSPARPNTMTQIGGTIAGLSPYLSGAFG